MWVTVEDLAYFLDDYVEVVDGHAAVGLGQSEPEVEVGLAHGRRYIDHVVGVLWVAGLEHLLKPKFYVLLFV